MNNMNSTSSNSKNSRDELIKKINYCFSKERETLQNSYRIDLKKEAVDFFIKTEDGSYTLNSPDFDGKIETKHNSNGAITESFKKFVMPFKNSYFKNINNANVLENENISSEKLKNLNYNEDIAILDICSGLGYNSAAAIEDFLKNVNKTS